MGEAERGCEARRPLAEMSAHEPEPVDIGSEPNECLMLAPRLEPPECLAEVVVVAFDLEPIHVAARPDPSSDPSSERAKVLGMCATTGLGLAALVQPFGRVGPGSSPAS